MTENTKALHPKDTLRLLSEKYPNTFSVDGRQVKPLAVGLIQELLADKENTLPATSARALRQAVRFYTQAISYHRAIVAGKKRINLQGDEVAEVTEDEKSHAKTRLEEIAQSHPDKVNKPKKKSAPRKRLNKPQGQRKSTTEQNSSPAATDKLSQLQAHFNRS